MEGDPPLPDASDEDFEAYSLTSDSEMSDTGEPVLDLTDEAREVRVAHVPTEHSPPNAHPPPSTAL